MITVKFFASLREQLATGQVQVDSIGIDTVAALQRTLAERGDNWRAALGAPIGDQQVLAAVNEIMARPSTPIKAGDEVAFFPPVTGG